MTLPIPPAVLYAGLVGVFLALVVATAQQRWQLRVFVILALRLAIGWHFLFEGLHKIHSHIVGPTETSRPFTSEPYFAAAEGPLGDYMRKKYLGDPENRYRDRLTPPVPLIPTEQASRLTTEELSRRIREEFRKLNAAEKANLCPEIVANDLKASANRELAKLQAAWESAKNAADRARKEADNTPDGTDETGRKAKADANARSAAADTKAAAAESAWKRAMNEAQELRLEYAEWVYGVRTTPAKIPQMNGEVQLSGLQRLRYIDTLQAEYDRLKSERTGTLGRGENSDITRMKQIRTDLLAAKNELFKDTTDFINSLKTSAGLEPDPPPGRSRELEQLDFITRYTITAVGAGLLLGLITRLWCVVGVGFLVMTYLTHPTVPWLTLPPMTEGNPLFINKNLIEALGLLVVLAHPTGRWLGLDALVSYFISRGGSTSSAADSDG